MNDPSQNQQPETIGSQNQAPKSVVYTPWVTYFILGITVVVFGAQYITSSVAGVDLVALYGEKINEAIIAGEIWRLVTPMFLHGSLIHLLVNMYGLYIFGPAIERFFGRTRYALLYFLGGISGNLVSFYLSPNPSLGASTALFGLVAAQGVFIYRNRTFFGNQARSILGNTLLIVAVNLIMGFSIPGIDNWGHMGGLLGGLAFAWAAGPVLAVNWLPGGGYRVVDENHSTRMWIAAAVEGLVVFGLVFLKIVTG